MFDDKKELNWETIYYLGKKIFNLGIIIKTVLVIISLLAITFIAARFGLEVPEEWIYILSFIATMYIFYSGIALLVIIASFIRNIVLKKREKKINDKNFFIRHKLNGSTIELEKIVKMIDGEFDDNINPPKKVAAIKNEIRKGIADANEIDTDDLDVMLSEVKHWILYLNTKSQKKNLTSIVVSIILSFAGINWLSSWTPKVYEFLLVLMGSGVKNATFLDKFLVYTLFGSSFLLALLYFVDRPEVIREKNRLYLLFLESIYDDLKEEKKLSDKK